MAHSKSICTEYKNTVKTSTDVTRADCQQWK